MTGDATLSAAGAAVVREPAAALDFRLGPPGLGVGLRGRIRAGGRLVITYDPARLAGAAQRGEHGLVPGEIREVRAHVRFHPGGQAAGGPVTRRTPGEPAAAGTGLRPRPLEIVVPADAARVEVWFQLPGGAAGDTWDSRYGQNYWFDVDGAGLAVPERSVEWRPGALADEGQVRVVADCAAKAWTATGAAGRRVCTRLSVEALVGDAADASHSLADVHLFDAQDALVHAATVPLARRAEAGDGSSRFTWDGVVHEGSGGGSGVGVVFGPDVHTVQYRLYAEVHGQIVTDGVLHQLAVPPDGALLLPTED